MPGIEAPRWIQSHAERPHTELAALSDSRTILINSQDGSCFHRAASLHQDEAVVDHFIPRCRFANDFLEVAGLDHSTGGK